jgi:hypothetical protein
VNKRKKKTEKAVEKTEKQFEKMEVINFHAAGMDAGSRSRYVATGQKKEDVREFGVYAQSCSKDYNSQRFSNMPSLSSGKFHFEWPASGCFVAVACQADSRVHAAVPVL